MEAQAAYWRENLVGAPVRLELPTDRPRPKEQSFAGGFVGLHLDRELTRGLKRVSQEQGATLLMTVLSAWSMVLSRLSGQEEVVIGVPTANRGRRELEGLIGFFVNTLALRIDVSGEPSVVELFSRAQDSTWGAASGPAVRAGGGDCISAASIGSEPGVPGDVHVGAGEAWASRLKG